MALAIFGAAITPIPFKLVCIGSGVMAVNLPLFITAAMFGRAIRFYFFAIAFKYLGRPVRDFALRHLKLVGTITIIVMILGFLSLYWL